SMDDTSTLDLLINESDITVSLLPYRYHTEVAKICINKRKPLVTTSYVQPEMQALDEPAKNAGVIILNETGLDPGIDHMSAMRIIDLIHSRAGKVEEFYSLCGALPAPEAADNPLRYKFSWSPKGVILASLNSALYLKNGKRVAIDPVNLFKDRFTYSFPGIGELEVYPNRDSIRYIDIYGIPETKTMYRGTFRFKGWCETLDAMKSLNMLDDAVEDYTGKTYSEFMTMRAGTGISLDSTAMKSLEWLGFFSGETVPFRKTSPVEITSDRMIKKMTLANDDRDMVVLQHIFLASFPDGNKEVIKSGMIDYGTPSTNTSIARTVALPAAIAAKMILEKKIDLNGVYRPVVPQIYNPVLDELKLLGIELKEEFGLPESAMLNE
ncbi:MAG TPA: saccharopine dehydrogenase C-terminal domain-containing protein, partial [Bacteroidales bacterium]|nr:saccharopine dehydrogenase C-terminal domain-containing protein [Bacteroidales bacterium]